MGAWYWPGELMPVGARAESAIFAGVGACIRAGLLPHPIYEAVGAVTFYRDDGMNLDNGVLGAVRWPNRNEVHLAPVIYDQLDSPWWDYDDLRGIAQSIGIVVHELTHLEQMRWAFGLAWPALNMPVVCSVTIEAWAVENQEAAERFLQG